MVLRVVLCEYEKWSVNQMKQIEGAWEQRAKENIML
jgi:hypothetical protein